MEGDENERPTPPVFDSQLFNNRIEPGGRIRINPPHSNGINLKIKSRIELNQGAVPSQWGQNPSRGQSPSFSGVRDREPKSSGCKNYSK